MTVIHGGVTLREVRDRGRIRAVLALPGPAFIALVAYVDPGNFATDFAGGAEHGYELAWVVVLAGLAAILVQYVTSKAGLVTGRNLPQLCRLRFCHRVNMVLWLQGELVAMATDLAEFVGTVVGLNLVFGIPPLPAGLLTASMSLAILALQQRSYRRFELAVIALLALVELGFGYQFLAVGGKDYPGLAVGLLPSLNGADTPSLAAGIVGATVMPHVVYLHSALLTNRVMATDRYESRVLLSYNRWDCVGGLGIAGLINLAMLGVAAALFADAAEPMPANCPVGNHGEKTTSVSRVNASSSSELCSRRLNRWVTAAIGAISLAAVNCSTLTFRQPNMTDHAGVPKVLQRTDLVGEWNVGRWPVQVVQIEVAQPGSPATILGRLLEMGGPAIQSAVGQLGAGEDDTPLVDHQFARVRPQRILDQRLVRVRSI